MERRLEKRWPRKYEVLVLFDNRVVEGSTTDVSKKGLGALFPSPLEINKEISFSVFLPIGRQELSGELLWHKPCSDGGYHAGVHLTSVPAEYLNYTAILKYDSQNNIT